jgi:intein-encoded DNA endonuclease-like protein
MGAKIELNIDQLYLEHCSGTPVSTLAKNLGISKEVIFRRFRSLGLETKSKTDLYNSKSSQIINLYSKKKSMNDIASILNIPLTQIWRVLKMNNVEVTEKYDYVDKFNKYHVSEYFDNIDTANKAYFLGILYADGNANRTLNHITLKLKASDKKLLEDLQKAFGIESKLYFERPKNQNAEDQFALKIVNKRIRDNFIRHGVIPRKTWSLSFPFWLSEDLRSHFVRGYFDGDGCLYIDHSRNIASYDVCGTYHMCSDLEFLIKNTLNINTQIAKDKNIFRTRIRRYIDIVKMCEWMYKDAEIFMERKYKKYLEIKEMTHVHIS